MLKFIKQIKKSDFYKGQIEHIEVLSPHEAQYEKLERLLPTPIQEYLDRSRIQLYTHQTRAINLARNGKNVVIATPTASGKTLAFNIPIFEALMKNKEATALYLYPTKALTNDQLQVLKRMENELGVTVTPNVYDGDTQTNIRANIRRFSRIILSNPYGIHQYLPWHYKWKRFLQNLWFIVIDEIHVYRGVFGSNVSMLIRRLLRICERYGSNPQIILSSATIANPKEHSKKLTGKEFNVVSEDGSERGKKYFLLWNPPFIDKTKNVRRSVHQETKDLFVFNVSHKMQTLCFTISRQMAELLTRWSRETLKEKTPRLVEAVTAYRAGYLPEERREIERNIRNKKIIGVASTNALELGIDIGSLDSVIISGYPGTIISTWQQAGRTGRTMKDSLATLVAFQNPLDQYFMKHPKDLFSRTHEHAIIDLENPYIVMGHLTCASAELPITENDKKYFPSFFKESLEVLERKTLVRRTPISWVYSGAARPVETVNLNSISEKLVTVICNGKILETMDMTKAYNEAYEGAVLLHQGDTYIVENLDLDNLNATVKQQDVDYYTEPKKTVDIKIKNVFKEKNVKTEIGVGDVEVTEFYHNYVLKTYNEVIGRRLLNLPPLKFSTVGIWFTIPQKVLEEIEDLNLDFEGGLHAVEHAMIAMTPFYAMCDRWDVGGVSTFMHIDTGKPTIFIYDGFEGGIGISEKIYELIEKLFETTLRLIRDCECEEGCPSCIYSAKCGNENQPLDKEAAIHILDKITQRVR